MKQKLLRVAAMLAVLGVMPLVSCNQSDMHDLVAADQHESTVTNNDVIAAANDYMGMVFQNTRAKSRVVKSVEYVTTSATRSGSDTILSVVNYQDNEGFVLMAKRGSTYELYGINNENNISLSDTTKNEGLAYYISSVCSSIGGVGRDDKDSIKVSEPIYVGPTVTKSGPYLSKYVREWHQQDPFNSQCETVGGTNLGYEPHCAVGCVPLAVSMILSHYQWPAVINGHSVNWQRVRGNSFGDYGEIAWLLATMGKYYLHSVYGLEVTETSNYYVIPTLRSLGYIVEEDWSSSAYFYNSHVHSSQVPILVKGAASKNNEVSEIGHMWVRDGQLSLYYPENATNVAGPYTEYFDYYVWGDGGNSNGYYKVGAIQGWKDVPYESDTASLTYRYVNLRYLPSVYPNK
ncbi:C10 family peptidase [uncultured Duncaniella sp.]|uniref:C10 family peptidase n=1 Tax=uncultured Duncaniella sp. TaxID=2768039 RepID=UPI002635E4A1|nr:C10 family peptidase [uncultured Duncaniella sp.]